MNRRVRSKRWSIPSQEGMTELVRFDAKASNGDILAAVSRDGAVVVENLIPRDQAERTLDEIMP